MSVKEAYFQGGGGVNEPTPKKKKYKSEPALVVQPRFKEPFYRNYDLYNTPGEHSPGAGWHDMEKYKSIQEFLKAKRKKLKGKYKADDSWQQDDGKRTKKNPNIKARAALFERIIKTAGPNYDLGKGLYQEMSDDKVDSVEEFREEKDHGPGSFFADDNADHMLPPKEHGTSIYDWRNSPYQGTPGAKKKKKDVNHIDFPIDDQVSIISPLEADVPGTQIGVRQFIPENDFAGRSPGALDFGRDYHDEVNPGRDLHEDILQKLFNKYLASSETGLFGLPDGVDPEGHDADQTEQVEQPYTGTSDIGTDMYEDKWNI